MSTDKTCFLHILYIEHKQFSASSSECKRFFSYSGEDITEPTEPRLNLVSAQSYNNQLYMIGKTIEGSNESENLTSLK